MAGLEVEEQSGNAYKCRVTLMAPEGKGHILDGYLASLTNWVDPSRQIVDVDEALPGEELYDSEKHAPSLPGCLVSPAVSIMLFMRETGFMCVTDIHDTLSKPPWQFHHKVELQNKNAPHKAVAQQEFYKLGDDLPLFAACPVLTENEHIRVQLYVRHFEAMMDFYRIITDTEMETSKPEFCIFELYRQNGLAIQLSLKRCQYIHPVPVRSAYISFNVKSIQEVKLIMKSSIQSVGGNVYTTYDPDGNLVVLYENTKFQQEAFSELANDWRSKHSCPHTGSMTPCNLCDRLDSLATYDDRKSVKSTSDSHDSGRVSDLEPDSEKTVRKIKVKAIQVGNASIPTSLDGGSEQKSKTKKGKHKVKRSQKTVNDI